MHAIKPHNPQNGRKVEVYRNLHTGTLSIRDAKTKRVIGHADSVSLTDAAFKVSEAGRQRAIREGRRNVHAFAVGYETTATLRATGERITYNPFRAPHFHYATTQAAATASGFMIVRSVGVFAATEA